jgi:tight adherence protein B
VLLLIGIMVLAAVFFATLTVFFMLQARLNWQMRATRKRLDEVTVSGGTAQTASSLLREDKLSNIPFLNRVLVKKTAGLRLKKLIAQAGAATNPGTVVLSMLSLGGLAFLVTQYLTHSMLLGLVALPIAGCLPYFYLRFKRSRRVRDFEELLPEALDMIVGSLRAGFTFELAMKLVAQEIPDPLGFEFGVVFEEQNLGVPLADAFAGLRERVPSDDLDLLTVALLIHRRTGGNLAEILEKTAGTIRDRFRLKREIRTKTAHGRFSGFILVLMPLAMIAIILMLNPDYFMILLHERAGQYALFGAVVMQILGIYIIRKIIDIKI